MTSKEIRSAFFKYFQSKEHQLVKSAPIIVKDDPTLLFTNAGMNQFKEFFLGNKNAKYPRIVDTQKCLRVSGKHNDLEEVGVDTYHHTMFEMLGNWSFGDFFKAEMIPWAWEFLTEVIGLEENRLYVTVFEGDKSDGLEEDIEAFQHWSKIIAEDRIIKAPKKENFWEMGEVGPCGPCSEIHIDLRSNESRAKLDGKGLVNQDHPQVVEIWNLVFMEFNRLKNGSLEKLPQQHVDTGMGLERLCMAVQGKFSTYDTDLFQSSFQELEKLSQKTYTASSSNEDVAFRVIVDHVRAIAFSIADGQLPSNTGAGYVIRRILRRGVRYGYSFLNLKEAFIYKLIAPLTETLGETFEELSKQRVTISKIIKEEEKSFLRTLEKGIHLFQTGLREEQKSISGEFAFELYDTYGFPIDLTQLLAREQNLVVDMKGFTAALKQQKNRSRKATKIDASDWTIVYEDQVEEFVGYDQTTAKVKISRYRSVEAQGKSFVQLVFNLTPFYPEGGGQVGDQGLLQNEKESIRIFDTKKENNLIVHYAEALPNNVEAEFRAKVDAEKRRNTAVHHTSTHLLHHALRTVLGEHIEQKGSLVHPDYLRFDFSHFQKLTEEELNAIESMVNTLIRKNEPLQEFRNLPIAEAKAKGAMALFGEKYGDTVRMIQFGDSKELCGGIHLPATGNIGLFKITTESAVAAGVRRIEALGGVKSFAAMKAEETQLNALKESLKHPKDLLQAVESLSEESKSLKKEMESLKNRAAGQLKHELLNKVETKNGINILIEEVELDAAQIKNLAFQLKAEVKDLFLVLGSKANNKPSLTVLLSEAVVEEKGLNASNIVRELAQHIQGGGGGQAFFATAGGKNPAGIGAALDAAREMA